MPPETLTKEFFAEAYGFDEETTDNLSDDALTWWPVIRQARNDAEARKMRDQQRHSRGSR
jgi:hypothetical protein